MMDERPENPFADKVGRGFYDRECFDQLDFRSGAIAFLIENGVPKRYADRTYSFAYEIGHSSGGTEILNYLYDLIEIFKTPVARRERA